MGAIDRPSQALCIAKVGGHYIGAYTASVTQRAPHEAWPTAVLVHLPVHASWLNQVEIYFSILQRKAITPPDFRNLDDLAARMLAFQDRYNATAEPFNWKYTRDDLNDYLRRLAKHDQDTIRQAA